MLLLLNKFIAIVDKLEVEDSSRFTIDVLWEWLFLKVCKFIDFLTKPFVIQVTAFLITKNSTNAPCKAEEEYRLNVVPESIDHV